MKSLLFVSLMWLSSFFAPNFNSIASALGSGNTDALSRYFDESVEVSVLKKEDTYSKAQATETVREFFTKNKPVKFTQLHQGTSKADSHYSIGDLQTTNGNYRVYLYMKVQNDNYVIQEMRFDKN
jgi:hypothetical protein